MKKIAACLIAASSLLILSPVTLAWNGGEGSKSEQPSEDPAQSPYKSSYMPAQDLVGEIIENTTATKENSELLNLNDSAS